VLNEWVGMMSIIKITNTNGVRMWLKGTLVKDFRNGN
jgi:hypothetical protein